MKLKYKLFLCIFPLTVALLALAFGYVNRQSSSQQREKIETAFAAGKNALSELQSRQEEALRMVSGLLSREAVWGTVTPANEKDVLPEAIARLQKGSGADIVFYAGPEGQVHEVASAAELPTTDEVRAAFEGFFLGAGALKRKMGFVSLRGKIYQGALASLGSVNGSSFIGVATIFPFGSVLRALGGFEAAQSGRDGHWSGAAVTLGSDDGSRLNNLNGDDIEKISLSNGAYLAHVIHLSPDVPAIRVAILAPAAAFDSSRSDFAQVFLFCVVAAGLASFGITWWLTLTISRPLELVAKSVQDAKGTATPVAAPLSITERKDEIGAVATSFNLLASSFRNELRQKEKALAKLEKYQSQLLELNHRLAKKLYENRVMLSLWKELEKAEDTKDFLSHILEEVLQGLPFHYGCIIIRPLAEIGPEVILARIERSRSGKDEISVTDILERSDRTLWLSSLSPELKDFLLKMNHDTVNNLRLIQEGITASIEPEGPARSLSVVTTRLAQGNQHMGSLHLITEKERFAMNASDEEFLLSVAAQMSVALDNRSLQYATRVDPLTRLYNRGYMNDRLREEMLRTSRTNRPFTLMLLDIDHFKRVNDTHGHPAGDEILVGLSALLKRSCRASDALCRYGGEEIALVLVDTPLPGAKTFAENLRKTIESESFSIPDGKSLHITASMGLAEFPSQAGSMAELIKHADDALYKAKREGRNVWRAFSA